MVDCFRRSCFPTQGLRAERRSSYCIFQVVVISLDFDDYYSHLCSDYGAPTDLPVSVFTDIDLSTGSCSFRSTGQVHCVTK